MAAGTGARVGHEVNKVYLPLGGRAAVAWSLGAALRVPEVTRVVLVAAERDQSLATQALSREAPRLAVEVVTGGSTRHASEWRGLQALAAEIRRGDIDIVVIHDAARPLASTALFEEVIAAAWARGGAVPVRPHTAVVRVDGADSGAEQGHRRRTDATGVCGATTAGGLRTSRPRRLHRHRHRQLRRGLLRSAVTVPDGLGAQHQDHLPRRSGDRRVPARR